MEHTINGERQYNFVARFNYVREAGTDAEKKAADMICEELKELGLEGRRETFYFPGSQTQSAKLTVLEPYQKEYAAVGCGLCTSTPEEGIEADFAYVENGDSISLSDARDKIVLVNPPIRKRACERLLSADLRGLVTYSGKPIDSEEARTPKQSSLPGEVALSGQENPIPVQSVPGVTLHYLDALELVTRGASRARLSVSQTAFYHSSQNIAVRIEGTDRKEEILTVTAHYDSVPAGPGAYDNMSGCAIVMELCRYFLEHRPRRTMEFVWFGAEEKGLLGSKAYVKAHASELARHRFNMNIDLAGQLLGGTVLGVTADPSACRLFEDLCAKAGFGMSTLNRIWSSDSNTFAWKRIPAMTLNRDGFGMHTKYDTIDWISARSLQRSAEILCTIAEYLAQADEFPFTQEIPAEFLKLLDEMY